MFKKILIPVDLDDTGDGSPDVVAHALKHAADFARRDGSQLRLVSVINTVPRAVELYLPEGLLQQATVRAEEELKKLGDEMDVESGKVSAVVKTGSVHQQILSEAETWGADLIVMCSHTPALSTYLLGSNAAHVVRHAPCSVTVLRQVKE